MPDRAAAIYQDLCRLLAGIGDQVDWDLYTPQDWAFLADTALREGAAPLAHSLLEQAGRDGSSWAASLPPPEVDRSFRHRLAEAYYHSAARSALLCQDLDRVLQALSRARIPVILLKGAALIRSAYPDPALRPMHDLDLLVRRADLRRALRAVQSCGFVPLMDNYIRYHVFLLGGGAGGTALELHWSLVVNDERRPGWVEWLWAQSQGIEDQGVRGTGAEGQGNNLSGCDALPKCVAPATQAEQRPGFQEMTARMLDPTAQVLYLAAHLELQHAGAGRLIWYYDLLRVLEDSAGRFDWDDLLRMASELGWQEALGQALGGVQERFGFSAFPPSWMSRLQASLPAGTFPAPILPAVKPGLGAAGAAGIGRQLFRRAWQDLGWRDRLGLLRGMLFPRPAYLKWRFQPQPGWAWPVWYLRRWSRFDVKTG